MTATSPGLSRLTRFLVRLSSRTGPASPAGSAAASPPGRRGRAGILQAGQQVIGARDDLDAARDILRFNDFYSMSECRDLVFHTQEHRMTLPGIKGFLIGTALMILYFLMLSVFMSAVQGVFNAALYRYACFKQVPPAFDHDLVASAWAPKS